MDSDRLLKMQKQEAFPGHPPRTGSGGGSGSGGGGGGGGSTKQWKKLSQGEIKKLQDAGYDPHDLKPNARYDLYKNQNGDISVFPKGNLNGPGDPTGLSIKNRVVVINQ